MRQLWCPAVGALSRARGQRPGDVQYQGYRVGRAALSRGPRRRCRPVVEQMMLQALAPDNVALAVEAFEHREREASGRERQWQ